MDPFEPFFAQLKTFEHRGLFENCDRPWIPLVRLNGYLMNWLAEKRRAGLDSSPVPEGLHVSGLQGSGGLFAERWVKLQAPLFLPDQGLWIGKGTLLEPTAIVKSPAVIGNNNEIRQGAYLRGDILVGDHNVIGHVTEMKHCIIMDHSEMGHFNYLGDSIVGCRVNMGAGSRLANLQFRSPEEKLEGFIHPIELGWEEETVGTGLEKLGAILGDFAELGCNAVLCPGTLLGRESWIYPNTTVSKGFYPAKTFLAPKDRKSRSHIQ